MSDLPPPPAEAGETVDLRADPMILASGVLVVLGLILLITGVAGNWHWKAAIWGAVVASLAAFALVAVSANARRLEFRTSDPADPEDVVDGDVAAVPTVAEPVSTASVAAKAKAAEDPAPPRPRFAGFGKSKASAGPADEAPRPSQPLSPPQPTNVQVMHVQGSNVRVAPTPQPMPIARPDRPASRPPSAPPATPPTIQVGVPRTPGFKTHQGIDLDAPVIQVRNRYHRSDCRYVAVADDAVTTTVGAARASNAMPCGVCRP